MFLSQKWVNTRKNAKLAESNPRTTRVLRQLLTSSPLALAFSPIINAATELFCPVSSMYKAVALYSILYVTWLRFDNMIQYSKGDYQCVCLIHTKRVYALIVLDSGIMSFLSMLHAVRIHTRPRLDRPNYSHAGERIDSHTRLLVFPRKSTTCFFWEWEKSQPSFLVGIMVFQSIQNVVVRISIS